MALSAALRSSRLTTLRTCAAPSLQYCQLRELAAGASGSPSSSQGDAADAAGGGGGGWMPSFLRSRLPSMLGGTRQVDELEDLTLDKYAAAVKRARQLGGLTGFVHGSAGVNDAATRGSMRLYEQIIEAMREEERADLGLFNAAARARVAAEVGCTTTQVDDCIARFLWMRSTTSKMAQLKRQGKEMPTTVEEVERMVGSWRQYKREDGGGAAGGGGGGGPVVPAEARGPRGQPCPLAGSEAGRNTKCPLTRKAYKACCGKRLGA